MTTPAALRFAEYNAIIDQSRRTCLTIDSRLYGMIADNCGFGPDEETDQILTSVCRRLARVDGLVWC